MSREFRLTQNIIKRQIAGPGLSNFPGITPGINTLIWFETISNVERAHTIIATADATTTFILTETPADGPEGQKFNGFSRRPGFTGFPRRPDLTAFPRLPQINIERHDSTNVGAIVGGVVGGVVVLGFCIAGVVIYWLKKRRLKKVEDNSKAESTKRPSDQGELGQAQAAELPHDRFTVSGAKAQELPGIKAQEIGGNPIYRTELYGQPISELSTGR